VYMAYSERLPTRLNPLAERTRFSQVGCGLMPDADKCSGQPGCSWGGAACAADAGAMDRAQAAAELMCLSDGSGAMVGSIDTRFVVLSL
jgi:hypothetical protein